MRLKPALVIASVGFCLGGCGGTSYRVPSESMVPTLKVGQVVGVDDGAFKGRAPRTGEIIVFHPPQEAGLSASCSNPREGQPNGSPCAALGSAPSKGAFVRRVVGLPGDRIAQGEPLG